MTCSDRIVIPLSLRLRLYESHQGSLNAKKERSNVFWWPGITKEITEFIGNCMECRERRPHEPLQPSILPDRPRQHLATDLFQQSNKTYLVIIDYFSRWIEIKPLPSTTASIVIARLKGVFASHGIPDSVRSDNGPQFTSHEYIQFAKSYGFEIATSSPHFPQSNGMTERIVQTAKNILAQKDPDIALLNYRNSKHSSISTSPAEALMGRKLKGRVPMLAKLLDPTAEERNKIATADSRAKERYEISYDSCHGAKQLPPLDHGQPVLLKTDSEKHLTKSDIVVESDPVNRTHLVQTLNGMYRRNRKHIQKVPTVPTPLPMQEPEEFPSHVPSSSPETPTCTPQPVAPPSPKPAAFIPRRSERKRFPTQRLIQK